LRYLQTKNSLLKENSWYQFNSTTIILNLAQTFSAMKRPYKYLKISLIAIVIAVALPAATPSERYFEIAKNLDIMATLFREVNTFYVDEINTSRLMQTGIEAMLESLDPYTNYIPEDDIEDYLTMTTGQYAGVGLLIGRINGKNTVIMPYEGYSAEKNGLKIGDELLKVEEIDVTTKSIDEIGKLLKGQLDTELKMTVKRTGQENPLLITLKREKITISNVPYFGMLPNNVGYIKLSEFTPNAGKEVRDAFINLKSKGATKIVLDLRDNPGGLLHEAVNVSSVFIPQGKEVVSTKGKVTEWNKTYNTTTPPVDLEMPLAVLISSGSASAAEIVAGVVQDYDRGVLVGQKSFGKGLVQTQRDLTYNAKLKVTTAKYYTPSGRCIQALDYTNRNEDGSVGKVPDSLKVAFKTKNGRTVYDGGGVDPDKLVERTQYAPITYSLVTKGLVFRFATEYYYKHPSIPSAREFKLTDAEYNEFVAWLNDKEFDYTTKVEKSIDELIVHAKKEKYYQDIEKQIQSLRTQVMHNKESDLIKFKDEITQLIEEEIASRYYWNKGLIEASVDSDPELVAAIQLLEDKATYTKTLSNQ